MNTLLPCPLVSVCIPFYNAAHYLRECLESVLKQTFTNIEILLINDGSTDQSMRILDEFEDERIRCIECEHDYIHSLNIGLQAARGKYIARMDADDVMLPERLQLQFDFMESHPEIAVCGGGMQCFGDRTDTFIPETSSADLAERLMLWSPLAHPTVLIRTSVLMEHGLRYDPDYIYAEDYKLWTEIVKYGPLANIPQIVLKYRVSSSQVTHRHAAEQAALGRLIRREMIDYYLSLLSDETETARSVKEQLLPVVDRLNEQAYFSSDEYLQFMYALVRGLRLRRLIRLSYEK